MRAAQRLALLSDQVTTDCVELTQFPELAATYQVRGVPKSVFNDRGELLGAADESAFLEKVQAAAGQA